MRCFSQPEQSKGTVKQKAEGMKKKKSKEKAWLMTGVREDAAGMEQRNHASDGVCVRTDRSLEKRGVSKSYHNSRVDTSLLFYLYGSKTSTCAVASLFTSPVFHLKNKQTKKNPTKVLLLTCCE